MRFDPARNATAARRGGADDARRPQQGTIDFHTAQFDRRWHDPDQSRKRNEDHDRIVWSSCSPSARKARHRPITMTYARGPRRELPLDGPRSTTEKRSTHSYVGLSKQLSAYDVMKKLLDFLQEAMLYRAESVLIRRSAHSGVQSAEIRPMTRVISLHDLDRRTMPIRGLNHQLTRQ